MKSSKVLLRTSLYSLVGLINFFYQPNWYYQNFWSRADFWDQWGFRIPYLLFCAIYAALAVTFTHFMIKFIKKYL